MALFTGQGPRLITNDQAVQNFLSDNFAGASLILSTTKENSAYSGPCFRVRKVSNSVETDIGFSGKQADAAALAVAISGSTGRVVTWYDQSGNTNHAQQATTTRQWQALVDTDGKVSFKATSAAQGMEVASHASIQPVRANIFMVQNAGYIAAAEESVIAAYTTTGIVEDVATWGFVRFYGDFSGPAYFVRNGAANRQGLGQTLFAGKDGSAFMINDYTTSDLQMRLSGGEVVATEGGNTTLVYGGSQTLILGNQRSYNRGAPAQKFRAFILYDAANSAANRDNINAYLASAASHALTPIDFQYVDADGFTWQRSIKSTFSPDAVDANNMTWSHEHGGYYWSRAKATTNNSAAYYRMEVRPGDVDLIVTGNERSEAGGGDAVLGDIHPGDTSETFMQIFIEAGTDPTASWLLGMQHHYDDGAGSPDLFFMEYLGGNFQVVTQRGGVDTNRGSPIPIVRGVWWAFRAKYLWSVSGTADTLEIWFGQNGTTLPKIVDISGSIFDTVGVSAFCKMGVYSATISHAFAIKTANFQYSRTANAYAAFVTSQPALPTHA